MRIIIDGRMYNESGIGRYIRNLVTYLQVVDKQNEYFILHLKNDYDKLEYRDNFHKVLANFRWYGIEEQFKLPRMLKLLEPNLVHFPHFNVPFFYNGKFIVTIHDLIHQHFSMKRSTTHGSIIYKVKQLGYKKIFESALNKSQEILVPSNFVKNQLNKDWEVKENKIAVTYEAVDDKLLSLEKDSAKKEMEKVLNKFNINSPYLLYVGNAHPHKNVEGLIKAFNSLKERFTNLSLVLSGNNHYFWQRLRKEFKDRGIIYTGYISDKELVALYKNAKCFILPSFEEGFGIPILEAMACGSPVVSSNAGSLPEVGGNAALYFDPLDQKDLAEKISRLLNDKKLRKNLIENGLKRCEQFSWKRLAQKTLEVYLQCA